MENLKRLQEELKKPQVKEEIEKFTNTIKKKALISAVKKLEDGNENFLMQRIFEFENIKWLFFGLGFGVLGSLIASYIVQITVNGYASLNSLSKLTIAVSLLLLGLIMYFMRKNFVRKLELFNMLKDETMRGFMEALELEATMKVAQRNKESTTMQHP